MGPGQPGRFFRCRVCLLCWTGDYPALAAVSGTHSKCCHWCTLRSEHAPEISRRAWLGYRRWLPEDDAWREYTPGLFPDAEREPAPPPRTHEQFVDDANAEEGHNGYKKDAPYKTTGVKLLSMLAYLPLFNLIWDICPDLMHIITGIWKRHIIALLKGTRTPAQVKPLKKNTPAQNEQRMQDHKAAKADIAEWTLDQVRLPHGMNVMYVVSRQTVNSFNVCVNGYVFC